ncbi:MAG: 6-carboxyhexanoate--CoA ligase [Candidatus Mariimomonas ferrooxydans]
MRASKQGQHLSGAEGIHDKNDVVKIVQIYTQRALLHEKGRADEINLIVEELKEKPLRVSSLPLCTLNTRNPEAVKKAVFKILSTVGVAERAIEEAYKSLSAGITMRGAMLMDIEGARLEPDLLRGVRVTRMGITEKAVKVLSKQLKKVGLNNDTVKEALILASKAHRHPMLLAELCISDDPSYTTGYVVTRKYGYIRLPSIKKPGIPNGGRAFFLTGGEVKDLIKYLQKTPVLIDKIRPCNGTVSSKELFESKSNR